MSSKLKERFARLGPIRDGSRVVSGSRVVLLIRAIELDEIRAVSAAEALARRGLSRLKAKRTVESAIADGKTYVEVPQVESIEAIVAELKECGLMASPRGDGAPDVKALRESMGLTQEEFALRYALALDTIQNWESGRRAPDQTARAYLRTIAEFKDLVPQAHQS